MTKILKEKVVVAMHLAPFLDQKSALEQKTNLTQQDPAYFGPFKTREGGAIFFLFSLTPGVNGLLKNWLTIKFLQKSLI